jgi:uncharacterized membrane protein
MMATLRRYFLTGLLAVTPLLVTVWILWRLYLLVDHTVRPWLERIPGLGDNLPPFFLTLSGVAAFLLLITLIGLFTRNLIGVAFFGLVERSLNRIPIIKGIFTATKQISEVFLKDKRTAFKQVVLFEYPRRGLYSIGFVTQDIPDLQLVNVFLPTTPNPTSGYLLMVPRHDTVVLPVTVEEGIRIIISGGSVMEPGHAARFQALLPALAANAADPAGEEQS